ncbi:hypothetical protein Aple_024840 [Acrocarpospora pleiomorpha]|uniref:Trypsin-co-occurring domain-containing protein n=1 Tax=Acrocarpospora pleiomorpha TaxID=90975 RepID=A0A5M3XN27_9ACTN|nr:CU044_2847 family protein [Acrocarpospora pleiomorpha]GES19588.1 hypothetical protein Aple_024840 [Acrocarpospora pleiomorpha]
MTLVRLRSKTGVALYVEASQLGGFDEEEELAGSTLVAAIDGTLDEVTEALSGLADQLRTALAPSEATKYSVEFGCELAVETGKVVAILGKGSAKCALKVTLEWDRTKT